MNRRVLSFCVLLAATAMYALLMVVSQPLEELPDEAAETDSTSPGSTKITPLPGPEAHAAETGESEDTSGSAEGEGEPEPVKTGKIRGVVLDERGRPVAGVVPELAKGMLLHDVTRGLEEDDKTDGTGRFEIEAPLGQEFRILVRDDSWIQDGEVTATAGGPDVQVRLRPLLAIAGTVIDDATEQKVDRAALLLQRLTPAGEPEPGPALGYQAREGSFVIMDRAAGRYRLTVTVAGYDAWKSDAIALSREDRLARVTARVTRSGVWGAIHVTLLSPDGTEVTKLNRAILHHPETGFLAMTDLGVTAPFRLEAPEGRQVLQVQADGYQPEMRAVVVPGNEVAEIEITLRAAGHVKVIVTDGDGKPAIDYRLRILDETGEELEYDLRIAPPAVPGQPKPEEPLQGTVGRNQLMPGGEITLKNLPPGRYRLEATKEGTSPSAQDFDVEAAGTTEVKLSLR